MTLQNGQSGIAAAELVHLGLLARRRGDRLAALAHFRAAVEADPAGIRPKVELARELAELGRPHEAAELLQRVLNTVPGQPQARALLAHLGGAGGRTSGRDAGQEACRQRRMPAEAGRHHRFLDSSPV